MTRLKTGDWVDFHHAGKQLAAQVVSVTDDDHVHVNVYGNESTVLTHGGGPGSIIFGVEDAPRSTAEGGWSPIDAAVDSPARSMSPAHPTHFKPPS